jgi:hypothetical protein
MSSATIEKQDIAEPDPDGSRPFPEGLDQLELLMAQDVGIPVTPEQMKAAPPPRKKYLMWWYYWIKAQFRHWFY